MMAQSAFAQQQPSKLSQPQQDSKIASQLQDSIKKETALRQFNNRFGKNDTIPSGKNEF